MKLLLSKGVLFGFYFDDLLVQLRTFFCIVTLEQLSTLCAGFFFLGGGGRVADNIFSISMYIMCVKLCLFSALSRRVGGD